MFGPYPHIGHESSWSWRYLSHVPGSFLQLLILWSTWVHGSPSNHRGGAVVQGTTGVWCFIYSNPLQIAVEGTGEWSTRIKNHPISPFPECTDGHGWCPEPYLEGHGTPPRQNWPLLGTQNCIMATGQSQKKAGKWMSHPEILMMMLKMHLRCWYPSARILWCWNPTIFRQIMELFHGWERPLNPPHPTGFRTHWTYMKDDQSIQVSITIPGKMDSNKDAWNQRAVHLVGFIPTFSVQIMLADWGPHRSLLKNPVWLPAGRERLSWSRITRLRLTWIWVKTGHPKIVKFIWVFFRRVNRNPRVSHNYPKIRTAILGGILHVQTHPDHIVGPSQLIRSYRIYPWYPKKNIGDISRSIYSVYIYIHYDISMISPCIPIISRNDPSGSSAKKAQGSACGSRSSRSNSWTDFNGGSGCDAQ